MNALDFLPFMGHSSIHEPFDDFLTANGVTKRPKVGGKTYETDIFVEGQGLCMGFDFSLNELKEDGVDIKSEGAYIFVDFEIKLIQSNKKHGKYLGILPHGLLASDNRADVEKKLGPPKRRNEDSDNYYLDGLVWMVAFEKDALEFIQFFLPSNSQRKHGLCP